MAKRIKAETKKADEVMVIACAGFRHRGEYVKTGETAYMAAAEAEEMAALHMVRILRAEAA